MQLYIPDLALMKFITSITITPFLITFIIPSYRKNHYEYNVYYSHRVCSYNS